MSRNFTNRADSSMAMPVASKVTKEQALLEAGSVVIRDFEDYVHGPRLLLFPQYRMSRRLSRSASSVHRLPLPQGTSRTLGLHEQARSHFVHGILAYARAASGAEGLAHAGVEQAQEVEAPGGSGHGGARIAGGILLADGDGGRDAIDVVHIGLFHALQELAGIGGKRLHIAPRPLGVDGVERQRRFAGPGDARDHGQLFVRDGKRDVLEVMDPRTLDPNKVFHWNFYYTIPGKGGWEAFYSPRRRWDAEVSPEKGKPCVRPAQMVSLRSEEH